MRWVHISALALLAACSSTTTNTAVNLPGPNSLAVSGRTLFIADTQSNELRVLDLKVQPRAFVRAPNPIFPLAIPTKELPRALGASTVEDKANAFSFALSTATSQVTVVSNAGPTAEEGLFALNTVQVPDTTLAIAERQVLSGDTSNDLVMAVRQAGAGALYVATFPVSLSASPADIPKVEPVLTIPLGNSIPQVLVASPQDKDIVAVGDRLVVAADAAGRTGGLAICNLAKKTVVRVDVGGPVMALAFDTKRTMLFGLLDTEACTGQVCSGIFIVDVSKDPPVRLGDVVPVADIAQGIAVGADATVTMPDGSKQQIDPVVFVSSSNGNLYPYNGDTLAPLRSLPVSTLDTNGNRSSDSGNGPKNVSASISFVAEEFDVLFEGIVTQGSSGQGSGTTLTDANDFAALGVMAGDKVVLKSGSCGSTQRETTVATVATNTITLTDAPAADCLASPVTYEVRVPGAFAVRSTLRGNLGRVAPQGTFTNPFVTFTMGSGAPSLTRNAGFAIAVLPFAIPVQTGLSMPGAMTYDPGNKRFYAAYTGGNALVEIDPSQMVSGKTDVGLITFH